MVAIPGMNKTKQEVYVLRQLSLFKQKNAADSRGIFTAAIYLEGCINRTNLGLILLIGLTKV